MSPQKNSFAPNYTSIISPSINSALAPKRNERIGKPNFLGIHCCMVSILVGESNLKLLEPMLAMGKGRLTMAETASLLCG